MSDEHQMDPEMQPRRRLGRGLTSLLGRGAHSDDEAAPGPTASVGSIAVEAIERNPWQPRKDFDADGMRELADSISEHGLLQPILVRELPSGAFQLIAGERRWQAARQAGLSEIPCRIVDVVDQTACEYALEENLKRKDLNDIEKAKAFRKYLDEFGATVEELAKQLSMSRPAVSNMIRLLDLCEPVQAAVHQGKITAGHARALLKLDEAAQLELCGRIQSEKLSVRETESLSKQLTHQEPVDAKPGTEADVLPMQKEAKPELTNHLKSLRETLRGMLGVKVEIRLSGEDRGEILVPFASRDEFESVLRKLRRAAA